MKHRRLGLQGGEVQEGLSLAALRRLVPWHKGQPLGNGRTMLASFGGHLLCIYRCLQVAFTLAQACQFEGETWDLSASSPIVEPFYLFDGFSNSNMPLASI